MKFACLGLALLSTGAGAIVLAKEEPDKWSKLSESQAPFVRGADGLPELRLKDATENLDLVLDSFRSMLSSAEAIEKNRLVKEKAVYDMHLKLQGQDNEDHETLNLNLQEQLNTIRTTNKELRKLVDSKSQDVDAMRKEFQALKVKLDRATNLTSEALTSIKHEHYLDAELVAPAELDVDSLTDLYTGKKKLSFVELGDATQQGNMKDSVDITSIATSQSATLAEIQDAVNLKLIASLRVERKQSESALKIQFTKAYKYGKERHEALLKEEKQLKEDLNDERRLRRKLKAAEERLQALQEGLSKHIKRAKDFLSKLGGVALAAMGEVTAALRNLSKK